MKPNWLLMVMICRTDNRRTIDAANELDSGLHNYLLLNIKCVDNLADSGEDCLRKSDPAKAVSCTTAYALVALVNHDHVLPLSTSVDVHHNNNHK